MRTIALAAAVLVAACGRRPSSERPEKSQTIEGLTLSQSVDGVPAWSLRSRLAELHEEERIATLAAPDMEFYQEGRVASRVTALIGRIRTDTHDVVLSSSVVMTSLADHSVLRTAELFYSAKSGRFQTPDAVEIRRPEGVIHGVGMEASPDLTEIKIFRQRSILNGKPR